MRSVRSRGILAALFVPVLGAILLSPAAAVEDGLMGARIGASYREVVRKFGHPTGILMNAGGGMVYQALPSFSAGLPVMGGGGGAVLPLWAEPVRVGFLGDQQAEWLYDMRRTRGLALGIVLSGEGADAAVTDIIVAGYAERLKGKPLYARTELGVTLQSTFATVLLRYGFPLEMEVFTPGSAPAPNASAGGARGGASVTIGGRGGGGGRGGMRGGGGGGGGRGGMRGGGGGGGGGRGGMRGGGGRGGGRGGMRGAVVGGPTLAALPGSGTGFQVELTQMRGGRGGRGGGGGGMRGGGGGGRGGMRGGGGGGGGGGRGGMRGGGGGGGGRGAGLPPLGAAASGPAAAMLSRLSASAMVDNQSVSFSRDCILTYNGIAFTLHDMRVIRIHVSE